MSVSDFLKNRLLGKNFIIIRGRDMLRQTKCKNIAIIDCSSGISGDMTVGAFLDMGIPLSYIRRELKKVALDGYSLSCKGVMRCGVRASKFTVSLPKRKRLSKHGHRHGHHTHYRDIKRLIKKSTLDKHIVSKSLAIFECLAHAEARVHGVPVGSVSFHEVGAVDSIIDILTVAICLEYYKVDIVYVRNLTVGSGSVETAHGLLPVPAPATAALLADMPVTFSNIQRELVTPTGAAIIRAMAVSEDDVPPATVKSVGYGAGDWEGHNRPNVVRVMLAETVCEKAESAQPSEMLVEANIDDMSPLHYDILLEKLFQTGAHDAYITPIIMKKSRPAHMLSVLCCETTLSSVTTVIFEESTTIGLRMQPVRRHVLERKSCLVKTPYGTITFKRYTLPSGEIRMMPEYESVKKTAHMRHQSFMTVYTAARTAARSSE